MKTLILDNFDSFTYNLYQYVAELGGNPEVFRNNELTLDDIARGGYTHIIISPGPGAPENEKDFGICGPVIKKFAGKMPILGVCLGHQGIIYELGGQVIRAPVPVHGKPSSIRIKNSNSLFRGLPETIEGMRYHSLIGDVKSIPRELEVIAETTEDHLVMGVAHRTLPLFGVQFHPESIGTLLGKQILKNFLGIERAGVGGAQQNLNEKEAEKLLDDMVQGKFSEEEMAKILTDLAEKGESVSEIVGMARGMRKHAVKLPGAAELITMDTCGTGGSGLQRMNISTTAAFVLAAAGVKIAKHGNRAASGRTGSFDLLESLGVNIQLSPEAVAKAIRELNIGFLFAPLFHPAMKLIAPVRKKLGVRTIFNLLGPLTNPAHPKYHLLGTTSIEIAEKLIEAMKGLDYTRAMVVVGEDGLDDVTLAGKTHVFDLNRGKIRAFDFSPEEVGMKTVKKFAEISGGTPAENAERFIQLLRGKATRALQDLLYLNCGFAFKVAPMSHRGSNAVASLRLGLVREKVKSVKEGIELARKTIRSGAAYQKFMDYKKFAAKMGIFHDAIRGKESISVIAEIKRYSPSYGKPFPERSVKELVDAYEKGGASALSVVTAPEPFQGSIDLLKAARTLTKLPILRKDFITETQHIDESKSAGADAVLLIAHRLEKAQLADLVKYAHAQNLDTVVEIHHEEDLQKIQGLTKIIIGINNRDLENFNTDVHHAEKFLEKIDQRVTIIVESAFRSIDDFVTYKGKIDAALIGTALLIAPNPQEKLLSFVRQAQPR